MKIITKEEAKLKRLNKFYTGKKCNNNHVAERYVKNGKCVSCIAIISRNVWEKKKKERKIPDQTSSPEIKIILNKIREAKWSGDKFDHLTKILEKLRTKQRNEYQKKKRIANPVYYKQKNKEYYKILMQDETFRKSNIERVKKWYFENKERKLAYDKKRKKEKIKHIRSIKNKWKKKQFAEKTEYAIKEILSRRVRSALKAVYVKKVARTKSLVGCEIDFLKKYIESKFKKGMDWDNYGKWEIDHIRPCSSFNLKNLEEQKECFHFSNLQPLWQKENRQKSDKY